MTQKVNGAAYPGIWVEKQVTFIKLTFNKDISALLAADLTVLGDPTTPAGAGTIADSSFAVVESAMVQALKTLENRATVLGVSQYDDTAFSVDVMLGYAEGWFALDTGAIANPSATPLVALGPQSVINAQAVVTTPGVAPTNVLGALVSVVDGAVTFTMEFVYMDGTMPVATLLNGALEVGPGATSGAYPTNSPTGTAGYYPVDPYTA